VIRELRLRDPSLYRRLPPSHWPCKYIETGGLPWYRELDPLPTKEAAYEAAEAWARDYAAKDPLGNMAHAHGVVADPLGGWRGVVNFFHSNT
jgi:hypothetical protein